MKICSASRGFVKPVVLVVVILAVVILGYYLWANNGTGDASDVIGNNTAETAPIAQSPADASESSEPTESNIPAFTQNDLEQGWYYGNADQKKPGTPSAWLHRDAGTRSAQWYDPSR